VSGRGPEAQAAIPATSQEPTTTAHDHGQAGFEKLMIPGPFVIEVGGSPRIHTLPRQSRCFKLL
jgi:hypothetical protein